MKMNTLEAPSIPILRAFLDKTADFKDLTPYKGRQYDK
jgi:hypothetical protein